MFLMQQEKLAFYYQLITGPLNVNMNASKNVSTQIQYIQNKTSIPHKEEEEFVFKNCVDFEYF